MDDDRPTALRDRDAALNAKQIGSAQRRQHRHSLFESRPAQRLFEDQLAVHTKQMTPVLSSSVIPRELDQRGASFETAAPRLPQDEGFS
jgi:hypothetical protein